jgi:hypothetical protein
MGIRIEWDNEEKTIIRHVYEGLWTLQDYYALIDENYRQIDSVGHKVDIINDLRKMAALPPDVAAGIRYAVRHAHPNEGVNVIVAPPDYVRLLIDAINKAVGAVTEVIHTDSIEKAYAIIAKHRTEQPHG